MSLDLPRLSWTDISEHRTRTISMRWSPALRRMPIVRDEGHAYLGSDAIRVWKNETSAKYRITVEAARMRGSRAKRRSLSRRCRAHSTVVLRI